MKELILQRMILSETCTVGELLDYGNRLCWTLEDAVRSHKIKGRTAIPAGRYKVAITYSNRFKTDLPLLLNVPAFEGIRIHSGNTAADTEGCVLVGMARQGDALIRSREAFAKVFSSLRVWLKQGDVYLSVINPAGAPPWGGK